MTTGICLSGSNVLITGGTRGLGKALGLAFARAGARVFLTYKWGSVDPEQLALEFEQEGLASPTILQSDAGDSDSMKTLMTDIRAQVDTLDVIISNVAFAKVVESLDDFKWNSLELSLRYSAWPLVELLQNTQRTFASYPRYVIAISSDGGEICYPGYAFAGIAKATLETLCRYLALMLKPHNTRVNAVRPGFIDTESFRSTFSSSVVDGMRTGMDAMLLDPNPIARACVALCSGWLDAVTGQVFTVDEGWSLVSPIHYVEAFSTLREE